MSRRGRSRTCLSGLSPSGKTHVLRVCSEGQRQISPATRSSHPTAATRPHSDERGRDGRRARRASSAASLGQPQRRAKIMENSNPDFKRLLEEIKSRRNTPLSRPATPPHPPCPPRPTQRTLMGADGSLYRQIPGMGGEWRPVTTIGGIQARATTIGGFPALPPTIGPRQPARCSRADRRSQDPVVSRCSEVAPRRRSCLGKPASPTPGRIRTTRPASWVSLIGRINDPEAAGAASGSLTSWS